MSPRLNRKLVAGAGAALAVAGGGAALAATQFGTRGQESQAVVDDAAKQLGISSGKLTDALRKALENRVDAAVAAGRLTKEQGDAMKARIESGAMPLFGGPALGDRGRGGFGLGPARHGFGFRLPGLDAVASYLGLSEDALRQQLVSGRSLADIAKAQGKSVAGLEKTITDTATTKLDAAVAKGYLTKEQEQSILSELKDHVDDLVNGTLPRLDGRPGFRFHFGRPASSDPVAPAGPTM